MVPANTVVESLHPATGYVTLVDDYASVWSLGRLCDGLGYSFSLKPRETLQLTEGRKTVTCSAEMIVHLVTVTKQSATPSVEGQSHAKEDSWHAGRNCVPETEVEETILDLLKQFSATSSCSEVWAVTGCTPLN